MKTLLGVAKVAFISFPYFKVDPQYFSLWMRYFEWLRQFFFKSGLMSRYSDFYIFQDAIFADV